MATLLLHGGAGTIVPEDQDAYRAGLREALSAGFAVLERGEDALSAVLVAVTLMEDNARAFNAGTGGSPNSEGKVECDAAVMNGWDSTAGAVGAVTRAKNPVLLAERVRLESPHVMLVGAGADAFVLDPVDNAALLTPRTRAAYDAWKGAGTAPDNSATVGAVACDGLGRLAAATSTGGMLGKWPGRIGDAPIIGAGTYADRGSAISCTGIGEAFIRGVTAKTLSLRVQEESLEASVSAALAEVLERGGSGGLICVNAAGEIAFGFNSRAMAYAYRTDRLDVEPSERVDVGLEPGVYTV